MITQQCLQRSTNNKFFIGYYANNGEQIYRTTLRDTVDEVVATNTGDGQVISAGRVALNIRTSANGQYYVLVTRNEEGADDDGGEHGEVIAWTEMYKAEADAKHARYLLREWMARQPSGGFVDEHGPQHPAQDPVIDEQGHWVEITRRYLRWHSRV